MKYVTKKCPVCGNEFVVEASAAEKVLGCTVGCLDTVQEMGESSLVIESC